ncbi:cell envelope integrity protein CreD [Cupriavidus numazuensis]|uniref:Inner membrane protein CreD n=1 Tax=Cupriavidus numazuensis TaxID=221992 RepID=A0ABN7Q0Y0_9BURK|nr:cell envelope integrity protein CreD [Cupriavidus numazuensis]CAG2148167.1 Inner membrane protein CreD [Cupriavidus numazuensis]
MNKVLLYKSLITGVLIVLILIPLSLVGNLVQERKSYGQEAEQSIWKSYAGPQTLTGPVLVVPYKEVTSVTERADPKQPAVSTMRVEVRQLLVFPQTLRVQAGVTPGERYRGIHKTLVYEMQSRWEGSITLPSPDDLARSPGHVRFEVGQPYLALGITDTRGLMTAPVIELDGKKLPLQQGAKLPTLPQGLHADLDLPDFKVAAGHPRDAGRTVPFALTLPLLGAQSLSVVPIAAQNDIAIQSAWPHPSFDGEFLPRTRTVDNKGFRANWSVTAFNTKAREQISGAGGGGLDTVTVKLIEPVNIYLQTERATKYGILFVLLTFAGFFLFELVKQLRIHPMQYLLVGLALALFFLLLLSLSEHIAFVLAYVAASAACIGLLGFYLSFVLRSWKRGLGFATLLTTLYGALYVLLRSEDNALVLGSLLLFLLLAAIMVVTRKVDWYAAGAALQPQHDKPAAVAAAGEGAV